MRDAPNKIFGADGRSQLWEAASPDYDTKQLTSWLADTHQEAQTMGPWWRTVNATGKYAICY